MRTARSFLASAVLCGLTALPALSQGTSFTYQGVLSQNGAPVNGSNDLTFTLYTAASGGSVVGTSNEVNDLVMTNGLFTVTLDFGATPFRGSERWLQIAARPGASTGAYTNLVPRQPITATPYAVYSASAATAGSAGSVAAANISGTIDDGHLSANVARLNVGNTFSESQAIRTSAGGLVISSSSGGQFGSGTLRVQGNTGLGTDPRSDHRLAVSGTVIASGFVGNGSALVNLDAAKLTGLVDDSQLSANIARRTNGNTFNGQQFIANGNLGIGTATPKNLLDVAAGGVIGNSTVVGVDQHDVLNRGTKVSFGYNVPGSEFNGMRAVINPGTAGCGNAGDLLFNTWECNISASREVMRINGLGNVGIGTTHPSEKLDVVGNIAASGNIFASGDFAAGGAFTANGPVRISGNVGIGQSNPGFPLNFENVLGDKIALFENAPGQPSFGFGIQSSLLQIHSSDVGSDVAFGYGTSAAMTETMRIKGNGNVGIGTDNPATTLDVRSATPAITVGTSGNTGGALYFGNPGHGIKRAYSGGNDVGLYTTAADVYLSANGTSTSQFVVKNNGNVGIGTANPARKLTVNSPNYGIEHTDGSVRIGTYVQPNGAYFGTFSLHPLRFMVNNGAASMTVNTDGNVGIGTVTPATKLDVAGEITVTACNITSDRNAKEQFKPVNAREVLAKVVGLPITEWQYKTQSDARHIGPMAQDFREAFALGRDEKHITSVDADGVALAAIQGLNEVLREQREAIEKLETRSRELEERLAGRLATLEKLVEQAQRQERP